jgi:hypothetical protein
MEIQPNEGTHGPKLHIGFFFLSLGFLVTLITSVVAFLNLAFSTLEKHFPDVLNSTYQYGYTTYEFDSIRTALATLIIFFPVFLVVSYFWKKHVERGMSHADEVVKKWLVYIILFLSSLVTIIDLVTLVRYFVSGEISTRFILKVLAALVVAAFVGMYHIALLTNKKKVFGMSIGVLSVIKSTVLVILLIGYSFHIMGSPRTQRLLRLDDRRLSDLQNIQYQVINFWQQKEKLPEKLTDLSNPLSGYSLPLDPEFEKGMNYEYKATGGMSFELCATFALPIPKGWREYGTGGGIPIALPTREMSDVAVSYPGMGGANDSWYHEAGRTCFSRTIDKDIYPPFPKSEQKQ